MAVRDVAIVSPYPPKGEQYGCGSVATYTAHLAHALADRGLAVQVVAPRLDGDPSSFDDGGVNVERCYPIGLRALPAALAAIRETDPDLVHVEWDPAAYGGGMSDLGLVPALLTQRTWRALVQRRDPARLRPVVTTLHEVRVSADGRRTRRATRHGDDSSAPARALAWALQDAVRRSADAVIVHEPLFGEQVRGAHVIPYGVAPERQPERELTRRQLRVDGRLIVLCFGVVAEHTGLQPALEGAGLAGHDVHLVVVGGETPRSRRAGYLDQLRHWFGGTATFAGRLPADEVAMWCAAADVALFPHPHPLGSSDAVAQPLCHGTPLLVSPEVGRGIGAPESLTVPIDADVLAERFRELAGPDRVALGDLRRSSTTFARARAWGLVATRHHELYEQLCGEAEADGRKQPLRRAG